MPTERKAASSLVPSADTDGKANTRVCGCTCPHCGKELEVLDTRKRVFKDMEYFSVITTCKQFQVIRFFAVHLKRKVCQPAKYYISEVVQRWIAPDGKTETVARLRCQSLFYCDLWNEWSDMEIRGNKKFGAYDIDPICTYPTTRLIPELKRNGFKGDCHNILPFSRLSFPTAEPKRF